MDVSPVNIAVIAAAVAGLVTVITTVVTGTIAIIRALHETRADIVTKVESNAAVGKTVGEARDKKLDRIEILVDGRYSQVLQELADLKQLVATRSGVADDQAEADVAQRRADSQAFRVAASIQVP